ncbi:acetate/propionate family kinase [Nisaea sp.]|uniref:acetate/propionate family kinase n=1 Tax=Nisaea sp. TaxID=2024842 RepID=UPI003B51DF0E
MATSTILVLNAGSSSLKFALFDSVSPGQCQLRGAVTEIGTTAAQFVLKNPETSEQTLWRGSFDNHHTALDAVLNAVAASERCSQLAAVGHRVVHGGAGCSSPAVVTPKLIRRLNELVPFAPLHLPSNISGIEALATLRPGLVQVACFDTAFHNDMPQVAQMTGLPRKMQTPELRRYGFHGLSYEYIVAALRSDGVDVETERIVVAHLGNGASLAAIRKGKSADTTMGFSTISGVPMGTRSGDIDPGLLLNLLTQRSMTTAEVEDLLTKGSGLLGLSDTSHDMRTLIDQHDTPSDEAIQYFCYHVRRHLVALTAPLEGIDRVVFTGGIGANAAPVRSMICSGLDYLDISLDEVANAENRKIISSPGSRVIVEARSTDEEAIIASHVAQLCPTLTNGSAGLL